MIDDERVHKMGRELQAFREAQDRPWFCRLCHVGCLKPHGKYGYRCGNCTAKYGRDEDDGWTTVRPMPPPPVPMTVEALKMALDLLDLKAVAK